MQKTSQRWIEAAGPRQEMKEVMLTWPSLNETAKAYQMGSEIKEGKTFAEYLATIEARLTS